MKIDKGCRKLIIGFDNDKHQDLVSGFIQQKLIGGILVNKANLDTPAKLDFIRQCHQLSDQKLLVLVDQEGGKVQRFFGDYGAYPSAEEVAELLPENVSAIYNSMAYELNQAGININCTPVVDLNINPACPIIGKVQRSFGKDAEVVHKLASICVREHKRNNVTCVYKHFPGHGSSRDDSHLGFTDVSATWHESELLPYKMAIKDGLLEMVMTAHVYNKYLDTELPFSLSPAVGRLLRKQLDFDNVIITDDLDMKSISNYYSFNEIFDLTTTNETDLILFSNYRDFKTDLPYLYNEYLLKIGENRNKMCLIEKSIMRIENIS